MIIRSFISTFIDREKWAGFVSTRNSCTKLHFNSNRQVVSWQYLQIKIIGKLIHIVSLHNARCLTVQLCRSAVQHAAFMKHVIVSFSLIVAHWMCIRSQNDNRNSTLPHSHVFYCNLHWFNDLVGGTFSNCMLSPAYLNASTYWKRCKRIVDRSARIVFA